MERLKKSKADVWYLKAGNLSALPVAEILVVSAVVVVTVPSLTNRNVFSSWGESPSVLGYIGFSG